MSASKSNLACQSGSFSHLSYGGGDHGWRLRINFDPYISPIGITYDPWFDVLHEQ